MLLFRNKPSLLKGNSPWTVEGPRLGRSFRPAGLQTLTEDVLNSGEIEGEKLDPAQVRSSIARRLGMDIGALKPADRNVRTAPMEGVSGPIGKEKVHFQAPQAKRLDADMRTFLDWFNATAGIDQVLKAGQAHLWFVTIHPFDDGNGRIADLKRLDADMRTFLDWFNATAGIDQVLKAGQAHLWFVTIHPFDDGNGRI